MTSLLRVDYHYFWNLTTRGWYEANSDSRVFLQISLIKSSIVFVKCIPFCKLNWSASLWTGIKILFSKPRQQEEQTIISIFTPYISIKFENVKSFVHIVYKDKYYKSSLPNGTLEYPHWTTKKPKECHGFVKHCTCCRKGKSTKRMFGITYSYNLSFTVMRTIFLVPGENITFYNHQRKIC